MASSHRSEGGGAATDDGIACVLLAAGTSRRFRDPAKPTLPKQLADFGGEPLICRTLRTVLASEPFYTCVVLGHRGAEIKPHLAFASDVKNLFNADFAQGQSTSVRCVVEHLQLEAPQGLHGALFVPVDQPWLDVPLLCRLRRAHQQQLGKIIVPTANDRRGAPVLFDRCYFDRLLGLQGDQGGRALLSDFSDTTFAVQVDNPRVLDDIDSYDDLIRLRTGL